MFNMFSGIFGGEKADLGALINQGALIVDVRTKAEYSRGHVKGSVNIPLDELDGNHPKLNKNKTIITCCASGMRSAAARSILKDSGFPNVYNGGSWHKVNELM